MGIQKENSKRKMILLLFLINPLLSLICYDCMQIENGLDSCNETTIVECEKSCMLKQIIDGDNAFNMRYCGEIDEDCSIDTVYCEACSSDLCNAYAPTTTNEVITTT